MRTFLSLAVVAILAAGAASATTAAHGLKGAKLAPMASVTLSSARATALAARPGVITDQELEKEGGGSGLRYSFDIKSNGKTFEVGVDAKSGKVLENGADGAHPD